MRDWRQVLSICLLGYSLVLASRLVAQCAPKPCPAGFDCAAPSEIVSLAVSGKGEWVATFVADGAVVLWDVKSGHRDRLFTCHKNVNALAFSPDSQTLVLGDAVGTIEFLAIPSGNSSQRRIQDRDEIGDLRFSPDGRRLASLHDKGITVWEVVGHRELIFVPVSKISAYAFSHDGSRLAVAAEDGKVTIWDITSNKRIKIFDLAAGDWSNALTFDHTDQRLVSGNGHNSIVVWDVETREKLKVMKGHADQVLYLTFLPDGLTLISEADDGSVRTWDFNTGRLMQTWKMPAGRLSENGQLFVTVDMGRIDCWDFANKQKIRTLEYKSPRAS